MESRTASHGSVRVTLSTQPLWRIRLVRDLPRCALWILALAGLATTARLMIAPPVPSAPRSGSSGGPTEDLAAAGYAELFSRAYLTWSGDDPEARQRALAPFVGSSMEADAGLQPPAEGEQQVQWTEVVQEREVTAGDHAYTVAAQTDVAGLVYLVVSVARSRDGVLQLASYPAFVGAPAAGRAVLASGLREVRDEALTVVVERALRNYLASSDAELAADLASEARVSLPAQEMVLQTIQHLNWSPDEAGAVVATVTAHDERDATYTLTYDVDVARVGQRWEVAAIEMDPDA
jgi:Conjugative transposon protein TcpC